MFGNKLSWVGGGGEGWVSRWVIIDKNILFVCAVYVVWVAGLTEHKTKPSSWGLAELGNRLLINSGKGNFLNLSNFNLEINRL